MSAAMQICKFPSVPLAGTEISWLLTLLDFSTPVKMDGLFKVSLRDLRAVFSRSLRFEATRLQREEGSRRVPVDFNRISFFYLFFFLFYSIFLIDL